MGTDATRYVDKDSILEDVLETQTTYGKFELYQKIIAIIK
jgi:hypothetical protein